jgi:hypothetical protein
MATCCPDGGVAGIAASEAAGPRRLKGAAVILAYYAGACLVHCLQWGRFL